MRVSLGRRLDVGLPVLAFVLAATILGATGASSPTYRSGGQAARLKATLIHWIAVVQLRHIPGIVPISETQVIALIPPDPVTAGGSGSTATSGSTSTSATAGTSSTTATTGSDTTTGTTSTAGTTGSTALTTGSTALTTGTTSETTGSNGLTTGTTTGSDGWIGDVSVTGLSDGTKISGTNEDRLRATATLSQEIQGDYAHARVDKIEFAFSNPNQGIAEVPTKTAPANQNLYSMEARIRLATTRFLNGELTIQVTATFSLWNLPDRSDAVTRTKSATVKPEVYNRAYLLGTQVEANGSPTHFYGYGDVSSIAMTRARSRLPATYPTGPSHLVQPAQGQETSQSKSQVGAALASSTLVVAFTHGLPAPAFQDSWTQTINASETATYVFRPASVPYHNLVLMYACSTLQVNNTLPVAFKVMSSPDPADRGYTGFTEVVWSDVLPTSPGIHSQLSNHTADVLDQLDAGKTLQDALTFANASAPPQGPARGQSLPMQLRGDPLYRLQNVYLTQSERNSLTQAEIDRWFYIR